MSMLGCKLEREKNYRIMAAALNAHYKNNKKVVSPLKNSKFSSSLADNNSPTKKGFNVRKTKRGNSIVKPDQDNLAGSK